MSEVTEQTATEPKAAESVPAQPAESWIFKNISNGDVIIQDLGYKPPSGMFSAHTIKKGVTEDLAKRYTRKQLRESQSLKIAELDMKLIQRLQPGEAPDSVETTKPENAELSKQVSAAKGTSINFQDPSTNEYDKAYEELDKKEEQEDMDTRVRRSRTA